MAQTLRPVSPHLQIYRWQITMLLSILHRATGIALAFGSALVVWGVIALAAGREAWESFAHCAGSIPGQVLLIGWTFSLSLHLFNGVRHLLWDTGWGFEIKRMTATGWTVIVLSVVTTALIWACVWTRGGGL